MDTEIGDANLDWIPLCGIRLSKAGVQFDAVRIDGDAGRCVADAMEELTGGDPGPIVMDALGCRAVYFLVPPRSTSHRSWPARAIPFNSDFGSVSYVPVPALSGHTWPLSWRCLPSGVDRFVHTPLLNSLVWQLR
ncbi:hypothetical protein [Streptomyces xanthochromogenes]|uniref:hypothetical protein n=1 Tax=Streptomyces xanthochromogenes TaxID=67384 RepID=UPI00167752D7|nr:hypothetical protein [Streptomyces xanthochromogenes]